MDGGSRWRASWRRPIAWGTAEFWCWKRDAAMTWRSRWGWGRRRGVGLATLALESGETGEAARHLAAAGALDPSLPASLLSDLATRIARP
jgi:hypothetical protein